MNESPPNKKDGDPGKVATISQSESGQILSSRINTARLTFKSNPRRGGSKA
jgi:hypothetical protein